MNPAAAVILPGMLARIALNGYFWNASAPSQWPLGLLGLLNGKPNVFWLWPFRRSGCIQKNVHVSLGLVQRHPGHS